MTRDQEIQRIFEIADDSLQGVFGYHFYVIALSNSIVNPEEIKTHLPNISNIVGIDAFPLTFSWLRYYRREDLISAFPPRFFERFQARISLTAICGVFDDLLNSFVVKLKSKGYPQHLNGNELGERSKYSDLIKWAFNRP